MRSPCERVNRTGTGAVLLAALVLAGLPARAQEKRAPATAPTIPTATIAETADPDSGPVLEPQALEILKAAWSWLGAQETYGLHADVEYDEVVGEATRLRVGGRVDLLVRRPDRFKVFFEGDRGQKVFLYDGKTFVLSDLRSKTWASAPVAGPNDAAVETIVEKLGVVLPLSDFLVTGAAYSADELRGAYVVGHGRVDGRRCHHVLLLLDDLDVQVWVEADGNPLIRKLVLTHREAPGQPQFEATFTEWYPPVKLSDYVFSFIPDDSFRKVELAAPGVKE